jgi:hypothetical protein
MSKAARDARLAMAGVARTMLAGEMDLLEGCLQLTALSRQLPQAELDDPDVLTIRAVDSELDEMPFGSTRALWAPDVLAEKDRQCKEYLAQSRPFIEEACRSIVARYSPS